MGERLSLEKLEGSGNPQLSLPKGKSKRDFLEVNLAAGGPRRVDRQADLAQDNAEVPVGEYSLYDCPRW